MASVHYAYDQFRNFGHQPPNFLASDCGCCCGRSWVRSCIVAKQVDALRCFDARTTRGSKGQSRDQARVRIAGGPHGALATVNQKAR